MSTNFLVYLDADLRWTPLPSFISTWPPLISFSESVKCQSYQKLKWAAQFVCLRFVCLLSWLRFQDPVPDQGLPGFPGAPAAWLQFAFRSNSWWSCLGTQLFSNAKRCPQSTVHGPCSWSCVHVPCVLVGVQLKLVACSLLFGSGLLLGFLDWFSLSLSLFLVPCPSLWC